MKWTLAATATAIALVIGCGATRPPNQLVDARIAYQQASASAGASMASSNLFEAKQALEAAERAYQKGETTKAKNLAYVAHRKAIAAQAKAETMRAIEMKRVALADFQHFREMQAVALREQMERAKSALADVQRQAEAQKKAREAADDRITKLEGVQAQKTEKGLVLTIAGNVLFAGSKSELLPTAKDRLAEIARALKDDSRTVLVVGHTDAQGAHEKNARLSEERAKAVRAQLLEDGVGEARLRSEGMAETMPVADNKTPEGRASNRRIEIIVEATPGSGHTDMPARPEKKKK